MKPHRALLVLACAVAPTPALAVTCSIEVTAPVSFGAYDPISLTPLDTTGTLGLTCTSVGASTVVVDLSAGGAPGFASRRLAGPGGVDLGYNLYTDASRTIVWGDGTSGTSHYGPVNPPEGSLVSLPVYARIPARQNVVGGAYGDTIVVTIVY